MFKNIIALICLLFITNLYALDGSFSAGESYSYQWTYGQVHVQCYEQGNWNTKIFNCDEVIYEPEAFSKFVVSEEVDADEITLIATHENGKQETKKSKFDSKTRSSKKDFNLLISTLFQKPLLKTGDNKIEFKLTKNDDEVAQGELNVSVNRKPNNRCYTGYYRSYNQIECNSYTLMCNRYFNDQRYCSDK